MRNKTDTSLHAAGAMLSAFVLWTLALCVVDVQAIGPKGSSVGFATLNQAVHSITGVNPALYMVTDWLGLVPLCFAACFGALGLALAGLLLGARGRALGRARPDAALARDIALGRVEVPDAAMRRERALQRRLALAGGLAFGLCMVPALLCLLNVMDPGDAGALFAPVRAFWICAGAGFGILCALEIPRGSSLRREAAAAAARSREERADGAAERGRAALSGAAEQGADAGRTAARVALLILAAALIAAGICNGGLRDVLQKATMICTECIGIG